MTMDPITSLRPATGLDTVGTPLPRALEQTTEGRRTLLPAPTVGGSRASSTDVGAAMATMMIDSAFAQRKTAREAKARAESMMVAAQQQQIEQMRQAADDKYDAAKTDAWIQIGTGAVTLAAIGAQAGGAATGNATVMTVGATTSQVMTNGGTDIAKGTGTLYSSGLRHDADYADATAKQYEHAAASMKTCSEDWGDDIRANKESVRKALDFLKDYEAAQQQTQAAALHRA
jgi:hypothetical protein